MLQTLTCTFFGHRDFIDHSRLEKILETLLKKLIDENEYVEFLVGRNGEFDQFVSSTIVRLKKIYNNCNNSLTLVLPYLTSEYSKNENEFLNYYDEVEICDKSSAANFKSAIQIRNREMIDRSHIVICYINRKKGGAYQTVKYAENSGKQIINLYNFVNL